MRFAGDFFGIPLVFDAEPETRLFDYFPDLSGAKRAEPISEGGARAAGGVKAAKLFTGFKTFEKPATQPKATPAFTGFKTLQTNRPQAQ